MRQSIFWLAMTISCVASSYLGAVIAERLQRLRMKKNLQKSLDLIMEEAGKDFVNNQEILKNLTSAFAFTKDSSEEPRKPTVQ